jgi:pantoate--beta-alanine ligase
MKILDTNNLLKNNDTCLVPTMGALHDGHISLIRKAKKTGLKTVVSIFINKLQFNDEKDFLNYPRDIENDKKILENLDVDFLFLPDEDVIYPKSGFENLYAGEIGNKYEGLSRPGHFDGVLTVVNRLFQLINPHTAIFGSKDIQQLFLIKKLILDKEYKINLIEEDTKRTKTGLALSSRNKLLSQEGLIKAENIYKALALIQNELNNSKNLIEIINKGKSLLVSENIHLDYLEILDMNTFLPPNESSSDLVVIIAVLIDGVRLIDNIQFKYEEIK